jgi:transcriptional regulator with XRE-family HTH domain
MNGSSLRSIRLALGLTLAEAASRVQVSSRDLRGIEGNGRVVDSERLSRLAMGLAWFDSRRSRHPRRWIRGH